MSRFALSERSLHRLSGVHPILRAVPIAAIKITTVDFGVTTGARTLEEQKELFRQGRTTTELHRAGITDRPGLPDRPKVTWTLRSRHIPDPKTGFARAFDVAAYIGGVIAWGPASLYVEISKAMKAAAAALNVPVEWGGDWSAKNIDLPHYQFPDDYHPPVD